MQAGPLEKFKPDSLICWARLSAFSGWLLVMAATVAGAVGGSAANAADAALADGLIVHYSLDDDGGNIAHDSSGNGFDGQLSGNPGWVRGVSGSALALKKNKDRITVPAAALGGLYRQVTVAVWSYGNKFRQGKAISLFWGGKSSAGRLLQVRLPSKSGKIVWYAGNGGGSEDSNDARTDKAINKAALKSEVSGQWNHWAFVENADSGDMAIYLNGQLWASAGGMSAADLSSMTDLVVGSHINGSGQYLGLIDDFRLYDRALSAEEVNRLYKDTAGSLDSACALSALVNGCFDGSLRGWLTSGAALGKVSHDGAYSAQLAAGAGNAGAIRQTVFGLAPNRQYRLSAWVAASGKAKVQLAMAGASAQLQAASAEVSAAWQPLSVDFQTGAGETSATVSCAVLPANKAGKAASGVAYCDGLTLASVYHPPQAFNDSTTVAAGASVAVDVLANDQDADGYALSILGFTQGAHGSVSGGGAGPLNYAAQAGFTGTDSFSYSIGDGHGGASSATVTVTITPSAAMLSQQHGQALWSTQGCGACHGDASAYPAAASVDNLNIAIAGNKGGMRRYAKLSAQDLADIASYAQQASSTAGASFLAGSIPGVSLLSNGQTLRKAAILLAARLPSDAEIAQAQTDDGLRQVLRSLMQGSRFAQFVYDTGNRHFLTAGAGNLSTDDFPVLKAESQSSVQADQSAYYGALLDARREPIELLRYIVENDRPYTEILTADYTMVTPRLAKGYEAVLINPFPTGADGEWVPARVPHLSARTDALHAMPYPHVGVLSSNSWLSRFPTTDTNRNRHRSKMVFLQFLANDIEARGQRPLDDSQNGNFLVPTMENPQCLQCHSEMEPVAGAFQNWGVSNLYRDKSGKDSLSDPYKTSSYYRNHQGKPWYQPGDLWYRDMLAPGFEIKSMPGAWAGLDRLSLQDSSLPRDGWKSFDRNPNTSDGGRRKAIDGDNYTVWQVGGGTAPPYNIGIDMGSAQTFSGIVYQPGLWRSPGHIGAYQIQVSNDGVAWSSVASGSFQSTDNNAKTIAFPAVTARYLRLNILNATADSNGYVSVAELYALKPAASVQVAFAENDNGATDSLQWLAREIVQEPGFARAAVLFWYKGLFGRDPVPEPVNPGAPGYDAQTAAFLTQEAVAGKVAAAFRNSGFKVRDLLVELVMSDLFRAEALAAPLTDSLKAKLAEVGPGRMLNPDELNAKSVATVGNKLFDSSTSGIGLLYSGFDGGADFPVGNTAYTELSASVLASQVNGLICGKAIIAQDLALPKAQRTLLVYADDTAAPAPLADGRDVTASIGAIRQNIQYLHARLLGENLPLDDGEIERVFQLYKAVYQNATPETAGTEDYCETRNGSSPGRRAWTAVLYYLMTDARFAGG